MFKRALPLVAVLFIACGDGDQSGNQCIDVNCGANGHCIVGPEGPVCVCGHG